METTQSFRLDKDTEILELPCDQDDGQIVIYWDEILFVFPGVHYIKNGNTIVKKLKGTGTDGNKPRIKHYPGVVLDVVLAGTILSDPAISPSGHSKLPPVCSQTSGPPGSSTDDHVVENWWVASPDSGKQVVVRSRRNEPKFTLNQPLVASLQPDMQVQYLSSPDAHGSIIQAIQNGHVDHEHLIAYLQSLKDEMAKNSGLVSDVKELALKNSGLVSDVKELALKNNELASMNNELASKNNKLVTDVKDLSLRNNGLLTDVKDLTLQNVELTNNITKLQEAFDVRQEEMKQLQVQALKQMSLLQNRVQVLMKQTYELHEYPIPRLFVILPQDASSWNHLNIFSNSFRLYFLCECGEHTMPTNTEIPHHIHLAKHEGYQLKRPTEFFQRYGRYVLTILKMLKFGISVAGVAIPAVSLLVRADSLDRATSSLKMLSANLEKGIDQTIGCLEKVIKNGEVVDGFSGQMENSEALEGADLRKLESFLSHKDGNKVLGNLFRTVTVQGHVKWVCIDHYRANYQEKSVKEFHDTIESLGGAFDKFIGRVKVHLRSKLQAEQLYQALEKAKSVYELDIVLEWDTTQGDFKKLRNTLLKSNVRALEIDLKYEVGPTDDILNRSKRYDPIFDIMRHPNTRSVTIKRIPQVFMERSSLLTQKGDFIGLRQLGFDLSEWRQQFLTIRTLASRSPNLTSLTLNDAGSRVAQFYSSAAETRSQEAFASENVGRVKIHLQSRTQTEMFYQVMENTKSFYEIDIDLDWDANQGDLERLRNTLAKTNVGALKLRVNLKGNTAGDDSGRVQRYMLVFDIMRRPFTHAIAITGAPEDFIRQSVLLTQRDELVKLKNLDVDLASSKKDIPSIKNLVSKTPNLSDLVFQGNIDDPMLLRLYMAIVEHQTYPITFATRSLCIPPLTAAPRQLLASHQHLTHLLGIGGVTLDALVLEGWTEEQAVVDAFANMEWNSTGLRELTMKGIPEGQEDQFIENIARIVSRSELDKLVIYLEGDVRRIQTLESVQWKHIRRLVISMDRESSFETRAMKALVESRNKQGGPVELDYFGFHSSSCEPISAEQTELLRSFIASTSIKVLDLCAYVSDMESVLKGVDESQLQGIYLRAEGYFPSQVDDVYDNQTNADKLERVTLWACSPTQEQMQWMKASETSKSPNITSLTLSDSGARIAQFYSTTEAIKSQEGAVNGNVGHVGANIRSSTQADMFFQVMENTKSFPELDLNFDWDIDRLELERLRDILGKTDIGSLNLRVNLRDSTSYDAYDCVQRYNLTFDIMRHPSIRSIAIIGAHTDFIQQSVLLSQSDELFKLKHLDVDLPAFMEEILSIKSLVAKAPNLSNLVFQGSIDDSSLLRLYMAIAEHQTYPITFASKSLCIPPLATMPNQELAPHQHLAHLLNIDSVRIDKLVLEGSTDDEAVVDAFAKVEGDSTGLREFTMLGVAEGQGDQVIQNIASIVSRSELIKLEVHLNGEERRAEILEPIQWQCIRRLKIIVDNESVGTRAMMASVKGRNGLKEPVELEFFGLGCDSPETMSTGQVELLRSFVASTSIKELQLVVRMALSDMESVVKSVDVSRLEVIYLWANGFTSSQVDHVLDCLRSATKLQKVYLFYYSPTEEQKEKMKTKGVILNELMW